MCDSIDLQHDTPDDARSAASQRVQAAASPDAASAADGGPCGPELASREEPRAHDATLEASRIAEIRERYARGLYDSPDILEEVARRLLARGDV